MKSSESSGCSSARSCTHSPGARNSIVYERKPKKQRRATPGGERGSNYEHTFKNAGRTRATSLRSIGLVGPPMSVKVMLSSEFLSAYVANKSRWTRSRHPNNSIQLSQVRVRIRGGRWDGRFLLEVMGRCEAAGGSFFHGHFLYENWRWRVEEP